MYGIGLSQVGTALRFIPYSVEVSVQAFSPVRLLCHAGSQAPNQKQRVVGTWFCPCHQSGHYFYLAEEAMLGLVLFGLGIEASCGVDILPLGRLCVGSVGCFTCNHGERRFYSQLCQSRVVLRDTHTHTRKFSTAAVLALAGA